MMRIIDMYSFKYFVTIVYMLQTTEYQPIEFLKWYWRTNDFSRVMHRKQLERTKPAKLLLLILIIGSVLQIILGLLVVFLSPTTYGSIVGLAIILAYPAVWAHLIVIPLFFGRVFIINPKQKKLINESKHIFKEHTGIKIAIAGSYGKTSMKELLNTVLSPNKKVAMTPANKNVSISHAYFASKLKGDEDILLIEYGEGAPGDVPEFASITSPNMAIITGIAPAHLEKYPTLDDAAKDIFSLSQFVDSKDIYVNADSELALGYIASGQNRYDHKGVLGWKISDAKADITGTSFVMRKGKVVVKIKSGLLGLHNVGPLALCVALAHEFGLSKKQIEENIAKTKAFEHRMQPRPINGAWIIDDTYNGNIEGMKAGLGLLKSLKAKRKIYVTPGLVDQGVETENVHIEHGQAIAKAKPDRVILMDNSVTDFIKMGLDDAGYDNELQIIKDPLEFYTNIEHFLASGDIVLMQNDWTDNYN